MNKLSETRIKLLTDIHLLVPNADKNQIATAIGTIGETIICNAFGWKNIDEDGFDAIDDEGALYEIKTMSNETNTHYVAYNHSKKKDRYDYLLAKKELGNSVTYEVLQAKNSFLSDSSNVLLQSLNLKNAKMNLNLLLGESIETNYLLTKN